MRLIEKTDNQIVFAAEMEDSIANSIRRYILQIPILAIDELEISKNDSPLYDETVAHRVGLVPIKMNKSGEKSKLKLSVKKEGYVYSGDLKGNADVVYKNIPITTLDKGQELEFNVTLKFGIGSEHAKYSPGLMFYRNAAEISLDKELVQELQQIVPEVETKEKGGKVVVTDDKKRDMTDIAEGIAQKNRKKAEVVPGKELIITIESFGQIDAKEIFRNSIEVLKKDLNSLSKAIDKA